MILLAILKSNLFPFFMRDSWIKGQEIFVKAYGVRDGNMRLYCCLQIKKIEYEMRLINLWFDVGQFNVNQEIN